MKSFSIETRASNLSLMTTEIFDLVVLGGGITGAGVARDAAQRGLRVALVEAADFASGTSSRSSKLVHGGLRYLENREFKLVFEALSERQKLFELAPHLVHPLRFMIPLYKGGRVGMALMGLGMWLYDALSLFQAPELHERLNVAESLSRMPTLQSQDLLGSYIYSDAYMDDDRLVHETLRSANEFGAVSVNYVKATGAQFSKKNEVTAVDCEDQATGNRFSIRCRHVVSSVGPWTDLVGQQMIPNWQNILRPTKGIHLTFEKKRLPLSSAVVMAAEKRIVFCIPRHEMVIVGTTDTDFTGNPATVSVTPDDVFYILGVIEKYFPGAKITEKDIVASYAGVRPLVEDSSASEGKTSREHTIFTTPQRITFVAGGKYTTYRLMAEQIVDEILRFFSIEDRVNYRDCATSDPLNPLVTLESQSNKAQCIEKILEMVPKESEWSLQQVEVFFDRHGAESIELLRKFGVFSNPIEIEALHAIEHTMCFHLVDFYSRRVPLFLAKTDHGESLLSSVSAVFQRRLRWSEKVLQEELKMLQDYMQSELSWRGALM
jgi:glycerol-3-phosphate dehydrogenase